ncbi:MAG: hypothetical protein HYV35_03335 [Lentisphaerae bacterium]|nr:hypothetical protein [Lentisphaerota bacterium]
MNKKGVMLLLVVTMSAGLSGFATTTSDQVGSKTSDLGYFLSLKQKGQLICRGRIQDAQGIWYDVWIVPGYVQPAQRAKTYLQRAGREIANYARPKLYHELIGVSGLIFNWAYDDCLTDFTIKGVPRAWKRYWSAANRRTSQRVFGWWLAYPWAFLESTVDTVVRIPAGLSGTVLGTALGGAVVPAYYVVYPTAVGTWFFAVDTVILPISACTWNTIITPPLAMVGQKPTPSRVDGFWVRQLGAERAQAASQPEPPISSKDIEALAGWGRLLLTTSQPYEDQRQTLRKQTQAEHEAINRKLHQAEKDLRSKEEDAVRAMAPDPSQQQTIDYLRSRNFDSRRTSQAAGDVRRYLENRKNLSPVEVNRIMHLLACYPPSAVTNQKQLNPKTDPVEHSIEVIKDIQ